MKELGRILRNISWTDSGSGVVLCEDKDGLMSRKSHEQRSGSGKPLHAGKGPVRHRWVILISLLPLIDSKGKMHYSEFPENHIFMAAMLTRPILKGRIVPCL